MTHFNTRLLFPAHQLQGRRHRLLPRCRGAGTVLPQDAGEWVPASPRMQGCRHRLVPGCRGAGTSLPQDAGVQACLVPGCRGAGTVFSQDAGARALFYPRIQGSRHEPPPGHRGAGTCLPQDAGAQVCVFSWLHFFPTFSKPQCPHRTPALRICFVPSRPPAPSSPRVPSAVEGLRVSVAHQQLG